MAEGAPPLREYGLKAHRGFESLSLRQKEKRLPRGAFFISDGEGCPGSTHWFDKLREQFGPPKASRRGRNARGNRVSSLSLSLRQKEKRLPRGAFFISAVGGWPGWLYHISGVLPSLIIIFVARVTSHHFFKMVCPKQKRQVPAGAMT